MFRHLIRNGLVLLATLACACDGSQDLAPVNPVGGMDGTGGTAGSGGRAQIPCERLSECPGGQLCSEGTCIDCSDDAVCAAEFGAEFGCIEGLCIEICTPGALDCICDDGECNEGLLCRDSQCVNCIDGVDGCPCREGEQACDEGLVCDAENGCEPCTDGRLGCPCAAGEMCDSGAYCENESCVPCNADTIGCACDDDGNCGGALICDGETTLCREPRTCDEINCALHQLCAPNEAGELVCLELCDDGYVWVLSEGLCAVTNSNCQPDHPASLQPQCNALNRECVEVDDAAACGECQVGFREGEGVDACIAVETCESLGCAGLNRTCTPATDHEDAQCGECTAFHLEEDELCRPVRTCEDQGCAGQNRACTAQTEVADALCGECIAFHLEEDGRCRTVRNCEDQGCAGQNRACTEQTEVADALCTVCLPSFLEEEAVCRAVRSCDEVACEDLNRLCTPETLDADATCGECTPFYLETDDQCRQVDTCLQLDCLGLNRNCVDEVQDADAFCDACLDGFILEDELCRPVLGCDDLNCRRQNRGCSAPQAHADASCDDCLPGYLLPAAPPPPADPCDDVACEDATICVDGECVEDPCAAVECADEQVCVDGACQAPVDDSIGDDPAEEPDEPPANLEACVENEAAICEPEDDDASILASCHAANRACEFKEEDPAHCGPCLDGFVEDLHRDLCVPYVSCVELGCAFRNLGCVEDPTARCTGCRPGFVLEEAEDSCRERVTCRDLDCVDGEICLDGGVHVDAVCGPTECNNGQAWDVRGRRCVDCPACGENEGETGQPWPVATRDGLCTCETELGFFHAPDDLMSTLPCDADGDGWVRENARPAMESNDPAVFDNARCSVRTVDKVLLRNHQGEERLVRLGGIPGLGTSIADLYEGERNDDQSLIDQQVDQGVMMPYGAGGRPLRAHELNRLTKACVGAQQDYNDNDAPDVAEWDLQRMPGGLSPRIEAQYRALNMFSHFLELHRGWYTQDNPLDRFGTYVIEEYRRNLDAPAGQSVPMDYFDAEMEQAYNWRMCPSELGAAFDENRPAIGLDFARISRRELNADFTGMTHHTNYKCVSVVEARPANPRVSPQLTTLELLTDNAHRPNLCMAEDGFNPAVDGATNPQYPQISCELVDVADIEVGFTGWTTQTWPGLAGSCEEGLGICIRQGDLICEADGTGTRCTAEPGPPELEVCDALDNDCDGLVDNADPLQLCPAPADTVLTQCQPDGQCTIAECGEFQVDVDGAYGNGCECEDLLAGGPNCQQAIDLGEIGNGIRVSPLGTLPEGASEEWFTVVFPSSAAADEPELGNPQIAFEVDDDAFEMDVLTGCQQPAVGCGDGDNGAGIGSWSFNDVAEANPNLSRDVNWPERMWIRVYRNEDVESCAGYRIRVSR